MRRKQATIILGISAGLSLSLYFFAAETYFRAGYPLDDAWIHQTYARNLALRGEWSFSDGAISGGSTAPLWSVLLSIGYFFRLAPLIWSSLLGWVLLFLTAVVIYLTLQKEVGTAPSRMVLFAAAITTLEWHLVWSAVSGMETLLAGFMYLLILLLLREPHKSWLGLGCLVGAAMWVRPDAVTLLGPILMAVGLLSQQNSRRLKSVLYVVAGFLLFMVPYLLFNLWLSGEIWPTTFFAKQAEYKVLQDAPFAQRFLGVLLPAMTGVGILLLPGFLFYTVQTVRDKDWLNLACILWWVGFHILYAWRLPAAYQHGRYLIPAMPVYLFFGLSGTWKIINSLRNARFGFVLRTTGIISIIAVTLSFWLIGAVTFAKDVAVIESEMVETARWVKDNLPADSVLAVHDIGAIGYFTDHKIVDLAGLISPEVIPFIRDEKAIAEFLDEEKADYLITFPEWYPGLVGCGNAVHFGDYPYSAALGGEQMVVFRWVGNCLNDRK